MTVTVSGVYKDGRVELLEKPAGLREGRVRVVLSEEGNPPAPRHLAFGKYRTGRLSTPEDFTEAEWHGDQELDERHGQ